MHCPHSQGKGAMAGKQSNFWGLRTVGYGSGVLALGAIAAALAALPAPSLANSLMEQLTIQQNSGTRGPARDQADQYMRLGQTEGAKGNWPAAIAAWQQAQQLYQAIGDMDGQGMAYSYLAAAYNRTAQPRAREDAMRRQLAVTRDQRDFTGQLYANNNLGRALAGRASGSPGAGTLFMEGMDVASSTRNQKGEYLTAQNMAWLANSLEQPDLTIRRYEYAFLPANQWYANPNSYAMKLGDRGAQRIDQARFYMGTRFTQVGDRFAAQAGNAPLQFQTLDNQVVAYQAMGRYDLMTDTLEERLALARAVGDPQEELATLTALGQTNLNVGRTVLAQRYYGQALVVAERLNDQQQAGVLRERLATFTAP